MHTDVASQGEDYRRWAALAILSLSIGMVSVDGTIVSIALPWIRGDLGFTSGNLVWIIDCYLIPYGGLVLLSGKLGDRWGHRRLLLLGMTAFTLASFICGASRLPWILLAGRIVQGVGSAIIVAVSYPLIFRLFPEGPRRVRALGVCTFAILGGSGLASVIGGLLMGALNWHWIFFVNVPVGLLVLLVGGIVLPADPPSQVHAFPDTAGAMLGTAAVTLVMYAIVRGNETGWDYRHSVLPLLAATACGWAFIRRERVASDPVVPLSAIGVRSLRIVSVMGAFWAASLWAWFVFATLHLQRVMSLSAFQVSLVFLPMGFIAAILPIRVTPLLLEQIGIQKLLFGAMMLGALGMLAFMYGQQPWEVFLAVLIGVVLLGVGISMSSTLLTVAGISDVDPSELGFAYGMLSTSSLIGGALGIATLVTSAAARTRHLLELGVETRTALMSGYRLGYLLTAGCALIAAVIAISLLQDGRCPITATKSSSI